MPRPKERLNRKEDIIKSAKKLFRENGLEKTTVDDIAQHVGISKGSIYLDFKSKEDIFFSIIEEYLETQFKKFITAGKNSKPPYLEALKELLINDVLSVYDLAGEGYQNCEALIYTNPEIKMKLNNLLLKWADYSVELIQKAIDNKEISADLSAQKIAKLIEISTIGFYPPYNCNMYYSKDILCDLGEEEFKEQLKDDVSTYLKLFFMGLMKK
ncbi:MAG: TetR/AcrR family transcriptional regulator [Candidatus Gastranaerophilales bacterium]|nr:TetR/AcrR family transcriptional regulator [Candidatus Gastranaerophilales bacterium]